MLHNVGSVVIIIPALKYYKNVKQRNTLKSYITMDQLLLAGITNFRQINEWKRCQINHTLGTVFR